MIMLTCIHRICAALSRASYLTGGFYCANGNNSSQVKARRLPCGTPVIAVHWIPLCTEANAKAVSTSSSDRHLQGFFYNINRILYCE